MREPLILNMLSRKTEGDVARLHMPGHKGDEDFSKSFPVAWQDITELSFSGCLSAEEGVIFEAEKNLAEIFGASRSFITTDGSTSAILAMCYVLSKRGKKVIIPRNSHKSVYNGLKIFNLTPLFFSCFYGEDGIIRQGEIDEELLADNDVAGVMVVSPDYYGNIVDLASLKEVVSRHGKILCVDGAHGAHLRFYNQDFYAGAYADIWVDGVHKTLPALTQTAILHVANKSLIECAREGLDIFRTTSPSYPLMASAEYGGYFAEAQGLDGVARVKAMAETIAKTGEIYDYKFRLPNDVFKLVLDCAESCVDGSALIEYLEKNGIFTEFYDGRNIVFMLSYMTKDSHVQMVINALINFDKKANTPKNTQKRWMLNKIPQRSVEYSRAFNLPWEWVCVKDADGRISADNIGFFPPCYPLFTAGEVIDGMSVEELNSSSNSFGVREGKIKVLK